MIISQPTLTTEQVEKAERYAAQTRDALLDSVAGLSASQWSFKPSPGRWSIAEILEHVALIDMRMPGIIAAMSNAPEPEPGWDEAHMDQLILTEVPKRVSRADAPPVALPANRWTPEEALQHFREGRERCRELLASPALRGHVIPHPIFGPWDGYHWLLASAAHVARHTNQILELKADPGFPQSGS